jgi:hypothetical protein
MPQNGEVVHRHDERLPRVERPAEGRTVEHVGIGVQAWIPEDVCRDRAHARGRGVRDLDDIELVEERTHVARGARARLVERRRVERYANRS